MITLYNSCNLDFLGQDLRRKDLAYIIYYTDRAVWWILEIYAALFQLSKVKEVQNEGLQKLQLSQRQWAELYSLRYLAYLDRICLKNLKNLLDEENDCQDGSAHFVADCRGKRLCLLDNLFLFLPSHLM